MEIMTIGGYNEVGKNMTAVKVQDEIVVFDMGLYLPSILKFQEEGDPRDLGKKELIKIGAIPDDAQIEKESSKVKAVILGHAHLDHIGALPSMILNYSCPVIGTPYTIGILKTLLNDRKIDIDNRLKVLNVNTLFKISNKLTVEFVNITHSTIQTSIVILHTPEGKVVYTNDFKLDNHPVIGKKPDYEKLKSLGDGSVKVLILDSLNSTFQMKTPSEKVAREMLKDVVLGVNTENKAIVVTTFSSHIARLRSIIDFGKHLNRKIVFLGRSLEKYVGTAENLKLVSFKDQVEIIGFREKVKEKLKRIMKNKDKYLIVCTGNQGEPDAVLARMARRDLPWKFDSGDIVIFSCRTIPTAETIANRDELEKNLRKSGVRVFKDIHVSVLPDTQVVVNDEESMKIKNIGDIEENEELKVASFDHSDFKIKWYNAKLIKHSYVGKIFNLKTKSGRSVKITSGHSVFKLSKGKIIDVPGDDLKIGDYLVIPKKFSWRKKLGEIDVTKYLEFSKSKYSPHYTDDKWIYYAKRKLIPRKISLEKNFARLLGYYLAEGSAPRHLSFVLRKDEKDLIREINFSIENIFPNYSINCIEKESSCEIQVGHKLLNRLFKKWFNENARTKKVPDFVFSASDEFKLNFLGAYLNGDGCPDLNKKGRYFRIRTKTASKKLASDLLYLMSQVGICAKFDHKEVGKPRYIAGNKKKTGETTSYVVRIQGKHNIFKLIPYLSQKYKDKFSDYDYKKTTLSTPESLPLSELDIDGIISKPNTSLRYYINCIRQGKSLKGKHMHINPEIIKRDSYEIKEATNKIINGDLLFDPIDSIEIENYDGEVYDFEVPNMQNFIGGFGGIFLHNSGHASLEDHRDMIELIKPKHIIPSHGDYQKVSGISELGKEIGYKEGKNIHYAENGDVIKL